MQNYEVMIISRIRDRYTIQAENLDTAIENCVENGNLVETIILESEVIFASKET